MTGRRGPGRLPDRLRSHLERTKLLRPGDPVLVALSGGLDSTVLLHLLRFPLGDLGLRISAAHLDHAMRPGSAADARWVAGLCRAWGVPLAHGRLDPPGAGEADARERRYRFLDGAAPAGARIATAHHRDDQAETVLFRAVRGTGLRGLRGIAPRRGAVVRPLLPFRRTELEVYAAAHGIRYRMDPTNRDPALARNRLRREVLPALEAARPGTTETLARLADLARAWERAWDAALERLEREAILEAGPGGATLARPVLRSYHPALRARVLRRVLRRYGSTPDRAGTHAALEFISSGPSGGELHVRGGLRLERDFDRIRVAAAPTAGRDRPLVIDEAGSGRGVVVNAGRRYLVAWGAASRGGIRADLGRPVFPLTIRSWRPGDRIRFDFGSKKLKKLFGERRLDRRARRRTPVVVDGEGRVLWVVGVARAEGVGEEGTGFQITVRHAGQH